jgi:hypothetical protein
MKINVWYKVLHTHPKTGSLLFTEQIEACVFSKGKNKTNAISVYLLPLFSVSFQR